jgi:hypothetical protein
MTFKCQDCKNFKLSYKCDECFSCIHVVEKFKFATEHTATDDNFKRVEPKVLSAEEYVKKEFGESTESYANAAILGSIEVVYQDGDKNGQLREWQRKEQVELREAIEGYFNCKFGEQSSIIRVKKALENLKPPYENQD